MTNVAVFPNLATLCPWEPPTPPFSWLPLSPEHEALHDTRGRQLFIKGCAIVRRFRDGEVIPPAPDIVIGEALTLLDGRTLYVLNLVEGGAQTIVWEGFDPAAMREAATEWKRGGAIVDLGGTI